MSVDIAGIQLHTQYRLVGFLDHMWWQWIVLHMNLNFVNILCL
jgi:hypothetical protein